MKILFPTHPDPSTMVRYVIPVNPDEYVPGADEGLEWEAFRQEVWDTIEEDKKITDARWMDLYALATARGLLDD